MLRFKKITLYAAMIVLLLMPDTLANPMGGMGEQARQMIAAAVERPDIHFVVIGSDRQERTQGVNYTYQPIKRIQSIHGRPDPLASSLFEQPAYVRAGMGIEGVDVVHAFDWSTMGAGLHLCDEYSVPMVTTVQLSYALMAKAIGAQITPAQASLHQINQALEMQGLLASDAVIQVSKSYAMQFKLFLHKTFVIGNGVDLSEWQEDVPGVQLPGDRPFKVVYLGRYAEMKGIAELLAAPLPDTVDLVFIGGPRGSEVSLHQQVMERAQADEQVHYLGPQYGAEKVALLRAADAVVMPSLHEPFGIVALEALASESILISSFRDGLGDFLTPDVAIPCDPTPTGIGAALRMASDLTQAERMGRIKRGLRLCEQHGWQSIARKVCNVYDTVLESVPTVV